MPCFTDFRVRVFTECLHAYAFDVALKTSREHAFFEGPFRVVSFTFA